MYVIWLIIVIICSRTLKIIFSLTADEIKSVIIGQIIHQSEKTPNQKVPLVLKNQHICTQSSAKLRYTFLNGQKEKEEVEEADSRS